MLPDCSATFFLLAFDAPPTLLICIAFILFAAAACCRMRGARRATPATAYRGHLSFPRDVNAGDYRRIRISTTYTTTYHRLLRHHSADPATYLPPPYQHPFLPAGAWAAVAHPAPWARDLCLPTPRPAGRGYRGCLLRKLRVPRAEPPRHRRALARGALAAEHLPDGIRHVLLAAQTTPAGAPCLTCRHAPLRSLRALLSVRWRRMLHALLLLAPSGWRALSDVGKHLAPVSTAYACGTAMGGLWCRAYLQRDLLRTTFLAAAALSCGTHTAGLFAGLHLLLLAHNTSGGWGSRLHYRHLDRSSVSRRLSDKTADLLYSAGIACMNAAKSSCYNILLNTLNTR